MNKSICAATVLLATTAFAGEQLADGVTASVLSNGEVAITIQINKAVVVRQDGTNGALALVGNINGVLSLVHLKPDGSQSVSVDIKDDNPFRITRTIQSPSNTTELFDVDADGLADFKIVRDKTSQHQQRFTRQPVDWKPSKKE